MDKRLNEVDFPTFGRPTIPIFRVFPGRPRRTFSFCGSSFFLSLPDISKWNLRKVIDMSSLFYGCSSLVSVPDISKWKLDNVDDISFIFYGCISLVSLPDISSWNKIKYGRHIYDECISILFTSTSTISKYFEIIRRNQC